MAGGLPQRGGAGKPVLGPGQPDGAGNAGAAEGGAGEAEQGFQRPGGLQAAERDGVEGGGECRVRQQPGGTVEGGAQVEPPDEGEQRQAAEAGGTAADAADGVLDGAEGVVGGCLGQRFQQAMPSAGVGEAAEEAGDGVGAAEVFRQLVPGVSGVVGHVEDGLQPEAQVGGAAALGGVGGKVGNEGGEGSVREGDPLQLIHLSALHKNIYSKGL